MRLPTRLASVIRDVVTYDGKKWAVGILGCALGRGDLVWYLISGDPHPSTNEVPASDIVYWLPDTHDAELARELAAISLSLEASL
jgi:hypothetical protein